MKGGKDTREAKSLLLQCFKKPKKPVYTHLNEKSFANVMHFRILLLKNTKNKKQTIKQHTQRDRQTLERVQKSKIKQIKKR